MAKRIEANVKPELLIWARESSGWSIEEAARKIQVKPERLGSWETEKGRPTIRQLRELARVYGRPLAVFYLPEPPLRFQAMRDYRRLPGIVAGRESPPLRNEIRLARFRRSIALDLYKALDEPPPELQIAASITDDPDAVADRMRSIFGISHEEQTGWRNEYEALNRWRAAIGRAGVLVFQVRKIEISEMRGFSIMDRTLPVVAVNIKDRPKPRIFSVLHEVVHLALNEEGLCDLVEEGDRPELEQRIEVFSNRVAGAVMVPADFLLAEEIVVRKGGDPYWEDFELTRLSNQYQASLETILRRLLILGRTTREFYAEWRERYQAIRADDQPDREGFAPPDKIAVSTSGPDFVRLVLNSYYQEKITSNDLSEYLNVRLKHLPKIEAAVFGRQIGFSAAD